MYFFYVFIYSFHPSTCFEHQVLIIGRSNCINTPSGGNSRSSLLTGIPSSHLHRLIIPEALFMYLFIHFISLHVSSIKCSSSGDRIVLIHHLVWLVCVSDCLVCRSGWNSRSSLLTGIPSSHLHRLIIPDVLMQFDLLMMSTVMLETCREMK